MFDFPYLRIFFECRVTSPLLSFTSRRAETIKGLVSREMKKFFPCDSKTACQKCDKVSYCIYPRFFNFQLTKNPFPYTIIPPLNPRGVYYQGEKFGFEIRLFGQCARTEFLVEYLAPSIEQGGLLTGIGNWYKEGLGRFQMSSIYTWENKGWVSVFHEDKGFLEQKIPVQYFSGQLSDSGKYTRIRFYTPFCLKLSGKQVTEPELKDIVYLSVMRARAVCEDPSLMIDNLGSGVKSTEAIFEKTDAVKNIAYYIGSLDFEKIPDELIPILKLGSFCHIGKSTTQGYGGFFLS